MSLHEFRGAGAGCGTVYWITGLPGAGKKTLAQTLAERLRSEDRAVVLLNGDGLRATLGDRYGHALGDRRMVSQVYGRLCRDLAAQGLDVVIATVSLLHEVQRWNRENIPGYVEIYLDATPLTIAARLPKGLIAAGFAGRIRNVPGVDQPIEPPERPDIRIRIDPDIAREAVAAELFRRLAGTTRRGAHMPSRSWQAPAEPTTTQEFHNL